MLRWHGGDPAENRKRLRARANARYKKKMIHHIRDRQNELNFRWKHRAARKMKQLDLHGHLFIRTVGQLENPTFTFRYKGTRYSETL